MWIGILTTGLHCCGMARRYHNKNMFHQKDCNGELHPKLCNIDLHNITHSLISWKPRKQMFLVQISLLIVTFLSLISQNLSLMQATKEVNPHPCIALCVNMWSVTFFFFFWCHLLNVGACICHIPGRPSGVDHTIGRERRMNSNSILSHATLIL